MAESFPWKISSAIYSEKGSERKNNEDAGKISADGRCFFLADGIGGLSGGEIAAQYAVNIASHTLDEFFNRRENTMPVEQILSFFCDTLQKTNFLLRSMRAHYSTKKKMGTTFCLAHIHNTDLIYATLGDTRVYQWNAGAKKVSCLSRDHRKTRLIKTKIGTHLYKESITQALGPYRQVSPSYYTFPLCNDFIYFFCTDGISNILSPHQMAVVLNGKLSLQEKCIALTKKARLFGGTDDSTIIMVKITDKKNGKTSLSRL